MTWQLFALAFITLDVVSGVMKGASLGELSSRVMRTGFWHKSALVVAIILCTLIDYALTYNINIGFDMPIVEVASGYIIMMEIVSICENLCIINPELKGSNLMKLLKHEDDEYGRR